jgi:hypothetical protein
VKLEVFEAIQELIAELGIPVVNEDRTLFFHLKEKSQCAKVQFCVSSIEIEYGCYLSGIRKPSRDYREGPAVKIYFDSGTRREIYYSDGKWHRPRAVGPASISYLANGTIRSSEYWEKGCYLSKRGAA